MNLVDTHCHIHSTSAKDDHTAQLWSKLGISTEEIIDRARLEGINKLICVGTDIDDSRLSVALAGKNRVCFASVGIHPHETDRYVNDSSTCDDFESLLKKPKVVAIGECGLDYFYHHSGKQAQIRLLKLQLDMALKHDLPLILHVREAFSDFWTIFDNYQGRLRGVLHSFTDSQLNLNKAVERGLFIGVNGIVTFNKDPKARDMYRHIPLERILLETDAPYLTPTPYRGNINEPKFIRTICEYLSELMEEDPNRLAVQSTNNAHLLFGI
jgi:TatD DNase family protein